jgi:hypothetical protein
MGGWSHFGWTGCVVTPSLNQALTPAYYSFHSSILLSVKQVSRSSSSKYSTITFASFRKIVGDYLIINELPMTARNACSD